MKCFYHPEKDAVGLCSACSRGLCSDCAAEAGTKLACRGRCEPNAQALADFQDGLARAAAAEKSWLGSRGRDALYFLAYIVVGIVFVWWSREGFFPYPSIPTVVLTIGICLIAFGALNILRALAIWIRLRRAR